VSRRWRLLIPLPILVLAVVLVIWRGPKWSDVHDAFAAVTWEWVAAAIGFNLLSVLARAFAWDTAIKQSIPKPHPRFPLVFSAFSVGLFANAVLPGRVGELARVAVLRRRMVGRKGTTATLVGSVFAHRLFDFFPALTLVIWVLLTAKIPHWALTSIGIFFTIGAILLLSVLLLARRQKWEREDYGRLRRLFARGREGLAIMRSPIPAATAASFQFAGWVCQLFAVWSTMEAFDIHLPISAAGLVLVVMNIVTIIPLWPGNFGAVQISIAVSLAPYHVAYAHAVAFGIGLQAIEASVGVGVGLIFLAREGLSYATLRDIEEAPAENGAADEPSEEQPAARAGIAG
jgi:glycosyltransferase 2 family protein